MKSLTFLVLLIFIIPLYAANFSPEHAFSIKEKTDELKSYLDSTDPASKKEIFYFLYYKRKALYMPAIMSLINYVNTSDSYSEINGYENVYDSIIINAPGFHIKNTINTFDKEIKTTERKLSDIDLKFFVYMKELSDYIKVQNAKFPSFAILAKGMNLVFSDISSGIDWEGDEHLHEIWNQYLKMNREGTLDSYLAFFFFFTKKETYGLPSKDYYFSKMLPIVNLFKRGTTLDSVGNDIKTLIVATYIKNFRKMPEIAYLEKEMFDEMLIKSETNTAKKNECLYLKERTSIFREMGKEFAEAFRESDALEIINNCVDHYSVPIIFQHDKIYIEKNNSFLTDIAVIIAFADRGIIKREDINIYLNIATLSGIIKYKENKISSEYGRELYYAYFTNSLKEYIGARFIYGFIHNPEEIVSSDLDLYLSFISDFYSGE